MEKLSGQIMREKAFELFQEVGRHFQERGVAEPAHIFQGRDDAHAFYSLTASPDRIVYVLGATRYCLQGKLRVSAVITNQETVSRTKEEGRMILVNMKREEIPRFQSGWQIPYEANVLEDLLARYIPELRQNTTD